MAEADNSFTDDQNLQEKQPADASEEANFHAQERRAAYRRN